MIRALKQATDCAPGKTHKKPGLRMAIGDMLFERDRLEMAAVERLLAPLSRRRTKARRPSSRPRGR
jgi:hypothetical protein